MTNRSAYLLDVKKQCREIVLRAVCSQSYSEKDNKWVLCNVDVSPKLQGKLPRCGLSALSMAAEMLLKLQKNYCTKEVPICEQDQKCDLDVLLTLARSRGFTCQGELYSAENIAQIAKESYKCNTNVVNHGFADIKMVILELLRGSAVLVPYDADRNHAPCMDNGHKAHWALLTGVLCELDNDSFDWTKCKQDTDVPILFHAIPSPELGYHGNPQRTYFCCKQGKSRHTAVWSLDSLKKSNENLLELDPSKEKQVGKYILPKGGIKAGLCSKIVIISNQNKR